MKYQMYIMENNGNFEIRRQSFLEIPDFNEQSLRKIANIKNAPYVAEVEAALRRSFKK